MQTLDAEGKHRFIIRGYEDFRYLKPAPEAGSLENSGAPSPSLAQFIPKDNADYTLYDLEGLTLADGGAAAAKNKKCLGFPLFFKKCKNDKITTYG